ncbi:GNAT family N-acetyltransferase [Bacillus sp. RAR_GA_16]|uniref:GNAT family N-acetyltransferase n=1 Tax=Bacillus sp. RAR_GA_16 TaxID=2876774 RepID=UPI001CCE204C|nr:GNAT family N-acetyltransferase [Bacillus sp. RAR_GA_16]MCA0172912.1 GNAT family N-acetyltransferase [Bacillus sp. RAR_GA_16]
MIHELDQDEFYKCERLLNEVGHVEAKAVIEGNNPGRVFVDDLYAPKSGLIWLGNHDGFFFIGEEENAEFLQGMNEFIDKTILPEARKLGLTNFIAIGNHSSWDQTIEVLFANRHMQKFDQNVYRLDHPLAYHQPTNIPEYEVIKISGDLLSDQNNSIKNKSFLWSKLTEFWASPHDFLAKGIGYGVVNHHQIVSLCFSGFVAGNVHGLDMETMEEHRGKKLGQLAASWVVNDCVSQGMIPYWDCEEANQPSNAIARKVGLEKSFSYHVYLFPI